MSFKSFRCHSTRVLNAGLSTTKRMNKASGSQPGASWLPKIEIIFLGEEICSSKELAKKNPSLGEEKYRCAICMYFRVFENGFAQNPKKCEKKIFGV